MCFASKLGASHIFAHAMQVLLCSFWGKRRGGHQWSSKIKGECRHGEWGTHPPPLKDVHLLWGFAWHDTATATATASACGYASQTTVSLFEGDDKEKKEEIFYYSDLYLDSVNRTNKLFTGLLPTWAGLHTPFSPLEGQALLRPRRGSAEMDCPVEAVGPNPT